MAFTEGVNQGTTNNTTAVQMVDNPSSGNRIVKTITINNKDTASATVTVTLRVSSTDYNIIKVTLAAGDTLIIDEPIVVPSAADGIYVVLSGTVTTNQLPFTASYGDST